jgi:sugar phosphate permease
LLTTERIARRTRGVFYGWWLVAGGLGIQALQSSLLGSAYTAYVVLLQAEFGWSKTVFSVAYSVQQAESGLLGPFQGWLIDRFGPRAVMRAGIVLFGIGLMLFSRVQSIPAFYAIFFLIAVGTSLGGFLPMSTTIVNWFERRRATAMGLMQTGMGIGGLLVLFVARSMDVYGWRATAFASGLIVIAVGLPIVQLIRHRPEDYGLLPDGDTPDERSAWLAARAAAGRPAARTGDFTVRAALRTPAFWLISLGHSSALLVVSVVNVHLIPHLKESLGYTVQAGALVVTVVTVSSMVGMLVGGPLGDRLNKRLIVIGCMFGHMAALLSLAYAANTAMVLFFAVTHGLAWGVRGPLMQAIRADYFGRSSYATIMGFSSIIVTIGTMVGPLLAGIMADRLGDYRLGFTILALLAGLGSVFWVATRKPNPPTPFPAREGGVVTR